MFHRVSGASAARLIGVLGLSVGAALLGATIASADGGSCQWTYQTCMDCASASCQDLGESGDLSDVDIIGESCYGECVENHYWGWDIRGCGDGELPPCV